MAAAAAEACLVDLDAAVAVQELAVDPAALGRAQQGDQVCRVAWPAQPPERRARRQFGLLLPAKAFAGSAPDAGPGGPSLRMSHAD